MQCLALRLAGERGWHAKLCPTRFVLRTTIQIHEHRSFANLFNRQRQLTTRTVALNDSNRGGQFTRIPTVPPPLRCCDCRPPRRLRLHL
jgi:hypothetical protein